MEGKKNAPPTSDELDTASLDPEGEAIASGVTARVPRIGDLVANKYRVESIIGRGGMGVVLAARHVQLRERVAIKILLVDSGGRGAFTSRFLREAQVAAQLRNEHIARVADVGTLGDGTPYMVMEYVEGHDLHELLRRETKLPLALAVEYLVQACEGLAEAHAQGVVHRDLKPPNLFLTHRADGSELIKILDFGISKLLSPEQPVGDLTETGIVMGSPKYMSPEQFGTAHEVDTRADIWALGAIFYELATGNRAFEEPTLATLCARVISGVPPRSIRELCADASEALERAVLHCLRVDREDRTPDVAELAAELLEAVGAPDAEARTNKIRATLGRTNAEKKPRIPPPSVSKMTSVAGVRAPATPSAGARAAARAPTLKSPAPPPPAPPPAPPPSNETPPGARPPARPGPPMLEFGGPRERVKPVTEWRSTWITSSFQALRERDLFKRYVEALPASHRESLPLTVTGIWIPVQTARVHYEACDRLGLSYTEARDLGLAVGERAQGSITRTAVALARTAGVDGWTLWEQGPRIWERGARGGAIFVYKTGPKEAVFEVIGCELFEVTYFRAALLGVILGMIRLVTNRAYAKELAREKNAFVARFQWV